MENVFETMTALGALTFFVSGFCYANSIEANKSKKVSKFFTILLLIGLISLTVGALGYLFENY